MNLQAFASSLRSNWFGIACIVVLGVLVAGFAYQKLFGRDDDYDRMNMSCFVFRDVNRNGIYDTEDRPYAGLTITMDRPQGGQVESRSNLAGFTNFKMSRGNNDYAIYYPGDHTITVEPGDDWIVTTGNALQTVTFTELEEAPVGMVANRTYEHVGIAPKLTISGSVRINQADSGYSIEDFHAVSPSGAVSSIAVSDTGEFSFAASPGPWKLRLITESGKSLSRELTVTGYPVVVSEIDPGSRLRPKLSNVRKVGFDDLTQSDTLYEVPGGYAGLNWNNWVATHHKFYRKSSHINGTISSEYLAYTSSGHPAVIWSESTIDFIGAFISMTSPEGKEHDVIIRAWRNGELAYEDRLRGSADGALYFAADYRGITKIEFSNAAYWHAAIDDFEYRVD